MHPHTNQTQKNSRPIGMWFLTITNGIFLGIIPILGTFLSGNSIPVTRLLKFEILSALLLNFLILVAAFATWKGYRYANVSLVGLLAIRFVALYILPGIDFSTKYSFSFSLPFLLIKVAPSLLWVVLNAWYFLPRPSKVSFTIDMADPLELPAKVRALHAVLGMLSGLFSFYPITIMFLGISIFISDIFNGNTNTDEFMGAILYLLPALVISLIFGLIGGHLGYKNNEKYMGSILGGLLGPIITLFPLSISILLGWLR